MDGSEDFGAPSVSSLLCRASLRGLEPVAYYFRVATGGKTMPRLMAVVVAETKKEETKAAANN